MMRATLKPAPKTRLGRPDPDGDVRLGPVDPQSQALRYLFEMSDALMARLYPAQSNHLAPAEALSGPSALLLGGFVAGQLVACGAVRLNLPTRGDRLVSKHGVSGTGAVRRLSA